MIINKLYYKKLFIKIKYISKKNNYLYFIIKYKKNPGGGKVYTKRKSNVCRNVT